MQKEEHQKYMSLEEHKKNMSFEEYGKCCYCDGPCNKLSQACGKCMRNPYQNIFVEEEVKCTRQSGDIKSGRAST